MRSPSKWRLLAGTRQPRSNTASLLSVAAVFVILLSRQCCWAQQDYFASQGDEYHSQGDFYVVGITPFSSDTFDVKLKNPRTGYVHSVTVRFAIGVQVGQLVTQLQNRNGEIQLRPTSLYTPPPPPSLLPATPTPTVGPKPHRSMPSPNVCGDASLEKYVTGFLHGFASCVGGMFYGSALAIYRDGSDFWLVGQALLNGDIILARQILDTKGVRNRQEFDSFIKSLNPNIYGASPEEAGFRDGSRFCQFGVIPVFAGGGRLIPSPRRILPQSGLVLQEGELTEASALIAINAKGGVGYVFETWLGGNLPKNFKTIDLVPEGELLEAIRQNKGVLDNPSEITSIKTLSTNRPSYASSANIYSTLKSYAFKLKNYDTACRRSGNVDATGCPCLVTVKAGPNTKRILVVGIPKSVSAEQLAGVDQAGAYARSIGVEMRVFLLSGVTGW
jgi:hypothetical protein